MWRLQANRVSNNFTVFSFIIFVFLLIGVSACTPVENKFTASQDTPKKEGPFKYSKLTDENRKIFLEIDAKLERIPSLMRLLLAMTRDQSVATKDIDNFSISAQGVSPEERELANLLKTVCVIRPHDLKRESINTNPEKKLSLVNKDESTGEVAGDKCPIQYSQDLKKVTTMDSTSKIETKSKLNNSVLISSQELLKLFKFIQYSEIQEIEAKKQTQVKSQVIFDSQIFNSIIKFTATEDTPIEINLKSNVVLKSNDLKDLDQEREVNNNSSYLIKYKDVDYVLEIELSNDAKERLTVKLNGEAIEKPLDLFLVRHALRIGM